MPPAEGCVVVPFPALLSLSPPSRFLPPCSARFLCRSGAAFMALPAWQAPLVDRPPRMQGTARARPRAGFGGSYHQYRWKGVQVFSRVSWVGITPGRRRSGRLPWGWGRHVGASFDAQKQPGVRCHVHRRGGPCDRWLSPPNYEEGLGRCPSAGVRRRGCWLASNTHVVEVGLDIRNKNRWVCPPDMSKVWR